MHGTFVIIETSPRWYQMLIIPTLFCVSAGPKVSSMLNVVRKYVLRFKTRDKLLRALENLECGGKVISPMVAEHYKEFIRKGTLFNEEIEEVIEEALSDVKEEKTRAFRKRQSSRLVINTPKIEKQEPQEITGTSFKRKVLMPLKL